MSGVLKLGLPDLSNVSTQTEDIDAALPGNLDIIDSQHVSLEKAEGAHPNGNSAQNSPTPAPDGKSPPGTAGKDLQPLPAATSDRSMESGAAAAGQIFDQNAKRESLAATPAAAASDPNTGGVAKSLERLLKATRKPLGIRSIQWSLDSTRVSYVDSKNRLWEFDWKTKKKTALTENVGDFYQWTPHGFLFTTADKDAAKLKFLELGRDRPRTLAQFEKMRQIRMSPDGKHVSFVRDNEIWILPVAGGKALQITHNRNIRRHAAQQESMGLVTNEAALPKLEDYQWSPDSKSIAYLDEDYSRVPKFPLVDYKSQRGRLDIKPYYMPGDPLPRPIVAIARLGGETKVVKLPAWAEYVLSLRWTPKGGVAAEVMNRAWTRRSVLVEGRTVMTDTNRVWVGEGFTGTKFLSDGRPAYLSEKSGHRHIYIAGKQVTHGSWNVMSIAGIDNVNGWITYTANEDNPRETQVWRVSFDGKKKERLTSQPGIHSPLVSPDGTRFLDTWSSLDHSTVIDPIASTPKATLDKLGMAKPEVFEIPARDGTPMDAMLLKPAGFDPSKKYPVVVYTYGGAYLPSVQNEWTSWLVPWNHIMSEKGFAVLVVDNRLTGLRSTKTVRKMHNRLGDMEIQDLHSAALWLKRQPWVDSKRLGLWGWSFGGYMAASGMTRLKDFAAGAAVAPVTDWKLYNAPYTEMRLGTPEKNPKGYEKSNVMNYVKKLKGRLMIIHGLHDSNVHFQHTDHLISALDDAKKTYDLRAYPGQDHHIDRKADFLNVFQSLTEFFLRYLSHGDN